MATDSIGVQRRRFVSICQIESDINKRPSHPLNRPPGEWQHLAELTSSLLQSCPPVRSSVLSFAYPIITAHLQTISQQQQVDGKGRQKRQWPPSANQPVESFILSVLSEVSATINLFLMRRIVYNLYNFFAKIGCRCM